jgi:hypothetical protein
MDIAYNMEPSSTLKNFMAGNRDFVHCRVLPYDLIPKQPEPSTQ